MNILVTGSRRWPASGRGLVWRVLDETAGTLPVHLVHGDCHVDGKPAGVDRWAQEWAEHRKNVRRLPTTWQKFPATAKYGPWPARGPRRSEDMVSKFRKAKVVGDKCLVFYMDAATDKGTYACRKLIKKYGMHANTFYYNKEVRRGDASNGSTADRSQGTPARLAS